MPLSEERNNSKKMETSEEAEVKKDIAKEPDPEILTKSDKTIPLEKTIERVTDIEKNTTESMVIDDDNSAKIETAVEEKLTEHTEMDVDKILIDTEESGKIATDTNETVENKESASRIRSSENKSKFTDTDNKQGKTIETENSGNKTPNRRKSITEKIKQLPDAEESSEEEILDTSSESGKKTGDESVMVIEEETDNKDASAEDDDKSKCSRELKLLLELSKEANLNTNIIHKRKSVDPKKLFNNDNLLKDEKKEKTVSPERKISSPVITGKRKSIAVSAEKVVGKKMKKEVKLDLELIKKGKDPFCWRCHKNVVADEDSSIGGVICDTCPRSFHHKCLKQVISDRWQCPECVKIVKAENLKTRSPSLKSMDLKHLCSLLKFALKRMIQVADCEPFMHPVPVKDCPDYRNYIVYPMDLTMMQKNIENNVYGSTDAFESDTKWILHNSIIYNSYNSAIDQSKLTSTAKYIEKICKQEMTEIENCSNCYLNANTKSNWFVEVCPKPHILIWAKLKGFPYWPAKAMVTNKYGMVDVRFFGAHDRAWVSHKDCYLYSQKNPNQHQMKKYNINECIMEVEVYIENLQKQFGTFKYAPFKAPFNPEKDYLKLFLPKYVSQDEGTKKVSPRGLSKVDKSPDSTDKPVEKVVRNLNKEIEKQEEEEEKKNKDVAMKVVNNDDNSSRSINDEKAEKVIDENKKEKNEPTEEKINDVPKETIEKSPEKQQPTNEMVIKESKEEVKTETVESTKDAKKEEADKKIEEPNKKEDVIVVEKKEKQKEEETKKDEEEQIKSDTKKDYQENDLLEVLYAEDIDGSKLDSTKSMLNGEISILSGLKETLSKALTISKKLKSNEANKIKPNEATTVSEDKPGKKINKREIEHMLKDKSDLDVTFKPKQAPEKSNLDVTIDSIAKGHGTIKTPAELNKSNSLLRPDLLLKQKKPETIKTIKNKRKSTKDDDENYLEVEDKFKKRKVSVDSGGKKHQMQDEVIIIKCEDKKVKNKQKPQGESVANQAIKEVPFENAEQRELFQALNISEKGTEVEKPKVHEIRTRSKTEEMFPNAFKQRARKSFPKTKSPPLNKEVLAVNKSVAVVTTASKVVTTTSTSQNLLFVPAPLLFQGANNNQLIAMVSPSNSSYTFMQQGSKIVSRPLNITPDQIKTLQNKCGDKNQNHGITNGGNTSPPALRAISNEVSLTRKSKPPPVEDKVGGPQIVMNVMNSATSDPLNSSDFTVLNGVVGQAVPNAIKDIFNRPPPLLKPRPPGPLRADYDEGVPSSAGPWTAKINAISHKLSDYLRGMLIETLNDVSTTTEDSEALVVSLQLEIESLKAKHSEEILEIKKNVNSILQDVQKSIIEEREKITSEVRAQCAVETLRCVEEAKTKQWCANCMKEAQFYCCWNTSYCDYPCQTKHWPKHMSKCTQNSQSQGTPQIMKAAQQIVLRPVLPPRGFSGGKPILSKQPAKIIMGKAAASTVRTSTPSITLIESLPGNFELITNGQIVDGNKVVSTPPRTKQKALLSSTAGNTPKTIILQSTNTPVMTPSVATSEKKADDPLAI